MNLIHLKTLLQFTLKQGKGRKREWSLKAKKEDQSKKEIWFIPIPIHTCKDPKVHTIVVGMRIEGRGCRSEVRAEILFKADFEGVDSRWLWKTLYCLEGDHLEGWLGDYRRFEFTL